MGRESGPPDYPSAHLWRGRLARPLLLPPPGTSSSRRLRPTCPAAAPSPPAHGSARLPPASIQGKPQPAQPRFPLTHFRFET